MKTLIANLQEKWERAQYGEITEKEANAVGMQAVAAFFVMIAVVLFIRLSQ